MTLLLSIAGILFVIESGTAVSVEVKPTSWCWFEDSFLYQYSSGIYAFADLFEAQRACVQREDCGGITQEPYNHDRFTLRKGPAIRIGRSPTHENSWVECEVDASLSNDEQDWCKFEDSFLYSYLRNAWNFATLSAAHAECSRNSDCAGITHEPERNKFTLRRGPDLYNGNLPSGETSWIACTVDHRPDDADVTGLEQNWCTFKNSFLYGYSSGVYAFGDLSEAQEQCALRNDCGGVTQEPYNDHRFTLRKGPALQNEQSPSGETAWVICDSAKRQAGVENWCSFEDSYLYTYSSGNYAFENLSDAQKECALRRDCGGITQEPYNNNRYTLRRGPALQNEQSPSGETAWVLCD